MMDRVRLARELPTIPTRDKKGGPMTRRDWVLAGAVLVFGAAGFTCWRASETADVARTVIGAFPLALALLAFAELADRSLR